MNATRKDGGQAFPSEFFETEHGDRVQTFAGSPGMSLRDWFAGQALVTTAVHYRGDVTGAADRAYGYAEAMLAARATLEPTKP